MMSTVAVQHCQMGSRHISSALTPGLLQMKDVRFLGWELWVWIVVSYQTVWITPARCPQEGLMLESGP